MRLIYSFFLLLFLFSGCSSKNSSSVSSPYGAVQAQRGFISLTPDTRVSEGVIIKIEVLERKNLFFGYGIAEYRYKIETFLDDGRVFTSRFSSTEAFFKGDWVRITYRGRKLDSFELLFR